MSAALLAYDDRTPDPTIRSERLRPKRIILLDGREAVLTNRLTSMGTTYYRADLPGGGACTLFDGDWLPDCGVPSPPSGWTMPWPAPVGG